MLLGISQVIEMKLKIEHIPVDRLVPYTRNARTHSDEQVAQTSADPLPDQPYQLRIRRIQPTFSYDVLGYVLCCERL